MEHRPESTPESADAGSEDSQQGFWSRMFGGAKGEGEEPKTSAPPAPPLARNIPRKRVRTIFDKAEAEQKQRFAKAAKLRRDRLTTAIGDRVERVITERMEGGEEKLAEVSVAFDEVSVLLGAIGRNLDEQGTRAERMAQTLERMPEAAAQERVVLETIAERLAGQAESIQSVPEVVSIVRHGSKIAEQRLFALQNLKQELELQREQRDDVIALLRGSAQNFTERMTSLEEAIGKGKVEARADATSLRQAIDRSTEQGVATAKQDAHRTGQMLDAMRDVSLRLSEGNALSSATVLAQEKAQRQFNSSQQELLDVLVRTQSQTVDEMHCLEEEAREREVVLARQNRLTLVGSVGFLAILGALFFSNQRPQVAPSPIYIPVQRAAVPTPAKPSAKKGKSTSVPASLPRR